LHRLINKWIRQFDHACQASAGPPYVSVLPDAQYQAEILKRVTKFYVVFNPVIRAAETGQQRLVGELFRMLLDLVAKAKSGRGVPVRLWELTEISLKEEASAKLAQYRAVADFLCTLTEGQSVDLFGRLAGNSGATALGVWLH
jgi:dGTPase